MPKKTKKAKTHATLQREKQTISIPAVQQESRIEAQPANKLHYSLSLPTQTHHAKQLPMSHVDEQLFTATKQDIRITVILASLAITTLLILSTILN